MSKYDDSPILPLFFVETTEKNVPSEPQNVVTADEDLPQIATKASVNPLLGEIYRKKSPAILWDF